MYSMMYCRTRKGLVTPGDQCTSITSNKKERKTHKHEKHEDVHGQKGRRSPVMCLQKEVKEHDDINGTWRCTTTGREQLVQELPRCTSEQSRPEEPAPATTEMAQTTKELQLRKLTIRHYPTPNTCCYQQRYVVSVSRTANHLGN